jgi:hypothetical protein
MNYSQRLGTAQSSSAHYVPALPPSSGNVARNGSHGYYDMGRELEEESNYVINQTEAVVRPPSAVGSSPQWTTTLEDNSNQVNNNSNQAKKSSKRTRLSLEPYFPFEKDAKRKAHERQMVSIRKRLTYVAEVHEETQFFFYARTSRKKNIIMVSKNLEGIDRSRAMNAFHGLIDNYKRNPPPNLPISFAERFPSTGLPPATYEAAFTWFTLNQSIKSMKIIYGRLVRANLVRSRSGSNVSGQHLNKEWYRDAIKPFFASTSGICARHLWDCFDNMQYYGAPGAGRQYKEFSRKHYIGLMQALDLLATARSEEYSLPREEDFSGNRLVSTRDTLRGESVIAGSNEGSDIDAIEETEEVETTGLLLVLFYYVGY